MNARQKADAIRALNDHLRQTFSGGTVVVTAGIGALGDEAQARILKAVRSFDAFTEDNDPWKEHDMGVIELTVPGEDGAETTVRVMFKVDYFDRSKRVHSPDPTDPKVTERVLTIMLASEW